MTLLTILTLPSHSKYGSEITIHYAYIKIPSPVNILLRITYDRFIKMCLNIHLITMLELKLPSFRPPQETAIGHLFSLLFSRPTKRISIWCFEILIVSSKYFKSNILAKFHQYERAGHGGSCL